MQNGSEFQGVVTIAHQVGAIQAVANITRQVILEQELSILYSTRCVRVMRSTAVIQDNLLLSAALGVSVFSGMEGGKRKPFDTLLISADSTATFFNHH